MLVVIGPGLPLAREPGQLAECYRRASLPIRHLLRTAGIGADLTVVEAARALCGMEHLPSWQFDYGLSSFC